MTKLACAYIGLGSNLNQPAKQLQLALEALLNVDGISGVKSSPWYQSLAVGPGEQPDYLNAVAQVHTALSPEALLTAMQAIENQQGRVRNIRWGARTLDLDLLIYEDCVMSTDRLTIPHPEIANRRFVLQPLYDLAPALSLPSGEAIADLLDNCTADELVAYQHAY